jgi:hypothetical protein
MYRTTRTDASTILDAPWRTEVTVARSRVEMLIKRRQRTALSARVKTFSPPTEVTVVIVFMSRPM